MKATHITRAALALILNLSVVALVTGCDSNPSANLAASLPPSSTGTGTGTGTGGGPTPTPTPTPPATGRSWSTDALLFTGSGTWGTEVTNLQNIMNANGMSYQAVSSAQLDAMTVDDMAKFGMFVFPGGAGGTEAGSLSAQTHANIREAVQSRGVSYIGFCAGAFIAQAPAPSGGGDVSYGLGVVNGPELNYFAVENQGIDIQMENLSFADGTQADILWYGGPVTISDPGDVIAKYPDGTAAISQVQSGNGFVIESGVHPTADQATLNALGMSSTDGTHQDIAWKLLSAALHGTRLAAF